MSTKILYGGLLGLVVFTGSVVMAGAGIEIEIQVPGIHLVPERRYPQYWHDERWDCEPYWRHGYWVHPCRESRRERHHHGRHHRHGHHGW